LLLIGIGLTSVYGNPLSAQKKIQIEVRDVSIEQFFQVVQDQSEFIFFYKDDVIENKKRISLSFKDAKVDKVLDKAFLGTNLTYKIIGQQIVVRTVRGQSLLDLRENFDLGPPQITVAGTIRDISGQPLPGVNVLVEGTTQGTQSDFDGHYSIRAAENATLVFSYLGMLTQKIVTDARTTI